MTSLLPVSRIQPWMPVILVSFYSGLGSLCWLLVVSDPLIAITLSLLLAAVTGGLLSLSLRRCYPLLSPAVAAALALLLVTAAAVSGWFTNLYTGVALGLTLLQWPLYLRGSVNSLLRCGLILNLAAAAVVAPLTSSAAYTLLMPLLWPLFIVMLSLLKTRAPVSAATLESTPGGNRIRLVPMLLPVGLSTLAGTLLWLIIPAHQSQTPGNVWLANHHVYDSPEWQTRSQQTRENSKPSVLTDRSRAESEAPKGLWETIPRSAPQLDYAGFSDELSLLAPRRGITPDQPILHIRAPKPIPLIVHTFDFFDGRSWTSSTINYKQQLLTDAPLQIAGPGCQVSTGALMNYDIITIAALPAWLPTAPATSGLQLPAAVAALDSWRQPVLPEAIQPGTRYRGVTSASNRTLCSPPPTNADLRLPPGDQDAIISQAANIAGHGNAMTQAMAIQQYLQKNFRPYANVKVGVDSWPVRDMLLDRQAASPETLASAMVIMLRSREIPARLVTGFGHGTYNPLTGHSAISSNDIRIWAAAWIDNHWQLFSAIAEPDIIERPPAAADAIHLWLQDSLWYWAWLFLYWPILWPATNLLSYLWWLLLFPLAALVAWQTAIGQQVLMEASQPLRMRWQLWRIQHCRQSQRRQLLDQLLQRFENVAVLADAGRKTGESARQWLARMADLYPDCGDNCLALLDIIEEYYYRGSDLQQHKKLLAEWHGDDHLNMTETNAEEIRHLVLELALQLAGNWQENRKNS